MECNKILVLVDGGQPSERAVDAAAALACMHRATVAVARVRTGGGVGDAVIESALARLTKAGVPARGTVLVSPHGEEAGAVVQHAAAIGADLVMVGSRGLAGVPAVLLGSFSQRVAAELDLPIVVVPAQSAGPGFSRWLVGAADRGEAARLLEIVASLTPGARVHIAVMSPVKNPIAIMRDMVDGARDLGLLASGQVVSGPDVAAALLEVAEEHRCRVIILGSRRPLPLEALVLGSVAQEVVHESRVPVVLAGRP